MKKTRKTLGQIAYGCGGATTWEYISADAKAAWEQSAIAVAKAVLRRVQKQEHTSIKLKHVI